MQFSKCPTIIKKPKTRHKNNFFASQFNQYILYIQGNQKWIGQKTSPLSLRWTKHIKKEYQRRPNGVSIVGKKDQTKKAPFDRCFRVAGVAGFEPTNNGVRVRGLTAWRHPYFNCLCIVSNRKEFYKHFAVKFKIFTDFLLYYYLKRKGLFLYSPFNFSN